MEEKFLLCIQFFSSAGFFMEDMLERKSGRYTSLKKYDRLDTFVISLVFLISFFKLLMRSLVYIFFER